MKTKAAEFISKNLTMMKALHTRTYRIARIVFREKFSLKIYFTQIRKNKNKHIQEVRSNNKINQKKDGIIKDIKQKVINY